MHLMSMVQGSLASIDADLLQWGVRIGKAPVLLIETLPGERTVTLHFAIRNWGDLNMFLK